MRCWRPERVAPAAGRRCGAPEGAAKLVQSIVAEHLVRSFPERVYYWKNRREVDFLVDAGSTEAPIEVKYLTRIVADDLKPLRPFRRGVLVSRYDFRVGRGIAIIPAALLLAALA